MVSRKLDKSRCNILTSATAKKSERCRFKMHPIWTEGKPKCPRCSAEMAESKGILFTVCNFTCCCGHVC